MDDLKNLTDSNNLLQISNGLQKLCRSIQKQKIEEKIAENNIKEIDFLKELCQFSNVKLSLLACQALVHLAEENVLQSGKVLTAFVSMLSTASDSQIIGISEGIISLLLVDLVNRVDQATTGNGYKCPFGLKPPQHPLILVLQKRGTNLNDITNKISGICNHRDRRIGDNSIEFLRPVFLYVLCNPNVIPDSKPMWNCLLAQCLTSTEAKYLLRDIFNWSRYETPAACLNINTLLNEAIEFLLNANHLDDLFELIIYQIAILKDVVLFGYDPRSTLKILSHALRCIDLDDKKQAKDFQNYLLILLAELVHLVSPVYLIEVLRILKYIIETKSYGNTISINMILDGLIIRVANANNFLSADCRAECETLIKFITTSSQHITLRHPSACSKPNYSTHWNGTVKYQHANIAIAYDLAIWSEQLLLDYSFCDVQNPNLVKFILQLEKTGKIQQRIQLFLRALLLLPSKIVDDECWFRIWAIVISVVKTNIDVSIDMIYFVLYLLAKECDGKKQLEILRGLSEFALVKENIPLILNTYRALTTSSSVALQSLAVELHVRLWKNENRAYQFLHKMLSNDYKSCRKMDEWEVNIVKAYAIKEICKLKPSQHGKDLVVHLSDILNASSDEKNDLATSLALDAIIILCNSHTVNISSTWKALGGKFSNETRPRSTKSLCKFFGEVPLLQSPTSDYEILFYSALRQLWAYVTDFDTVAVIEPALKALKHFNMAELSLKHIPALFQENLKIPSEYQKQISAAAAAAAASDGDTSEPLTATDVIPYIPGECWIQLLEKVNQSSVEAAVDLVYQLIENEISQFRSGVYMLTGGRSEPIELTQLHARSPLRALVKYVTAQSKLPHPDNVPVLLNCLKCLSRKFSKPIPPYDWFFLLDLLDRTFVHEEFPYQLRSYCLKLASNQIANSGSARNLIENYLQQFRVHCRYNEEIRCVLDVVPQICHGCNSDILKRFVNEVSDFAYEQSKSCNFEKDCLLEVLLNALMPIYQERYLMEENCCIITQLISKYYDILAVDNKFFRVYSQLLIHLPNDDLQQLTTPGNWTLENFQKAAIVRGKLCDLGIKYPTNDNSLIWLNLIIGNAQNSEQQQLTISQIFRSLTLQPRPDRQVYEWLMHLLEKIQSSITTSETRQCTFLLNIFMLGVSVMSGLSVLSNTAPTSLDHTTALFPESLGILSGRSSLNDLMIRVYEFIYYFSTTKEVFSADVYAVIVHALMCCRNTDYFLAKTNWTKYLALKLNN